MNSGLIEMTENELYAIDGGFGIIGSFVIGTIVGGVIIGGGYLACKLFK